MGLVALLLGRMTLVNHEVTERSWGSTEFREGTTT